MAENTLSIEQNISPVGGNFSKTIIVDSGNTEAVTSHGDSVTRHGDIAATIEFVEKIYSYLPELGFVTIYGLMVYALVRWITVKIR
jgi:hypothetical protein